MEKKYRTIWSVSLLIISCVTLIISITNIASADLPDMLKRILGAADLLALPFLIYSSLKLKIWKKKDMD